MYSEKELQLEITRFTRLCKEKQEQVLNTFTNEEKRLNAQYHKKLDKLLKRQHKESEQLTNQLKKKQKAVRQRLKKEQAELRLIKQYEGRKTRSTCGIGEVVRLSSEGQNRGHRPSQQAVEVIDALSDLAISRESSDIVEEHLGSSDARPGVSASQSNGHNDRDTESEPEKKLNRLLDSLKQQMDERMKYTQSSANMAVAELEWKFVQERHNLKREYMELTAEFKQGRLISLSQLKKNQLRGYYDVHRKWLTDQHTRELDLRQRTCQEALKRLTSAQAVERHTTCRVAETTAKGQRQMSRILNAIESKGENGWHNRPGNSISTQDLYTPGSDNSGGGHRPVAKDTTLIDVLFPQTGESTSENSPRETEAAALQRSNYGLPVTEAGSSSIAPSEQDGAPSLPGYRVAGYRHLRGRYDPGRQGLRHAKSMQSLQSTLVTCGDMQRSLINSISRQHMDQWAEVMNRERELTDVVIRAQASQKQSLVTEENAALRRTELEQNYRMSHLAVYLEASEKFMEKEFAEERNRLMEYYFKKRPDEPLPHNTTLPFTFLDEYNYRHGNEGIPPEMSSETPNSLELTDCNSKLDKSVETNEEDFQIALSVNRR